MRSRIKFDNSNDPPTIQLIELLPRDLSPMGKITAMEPGYDRMKAKSLNRQNVEKRDSARSNLRSNSYSPQMNKKLRFDDELAGRENSPIRTRSSTNFVTTKTNTGDKQDRKITRNYSNFSNLIKCKQEIPRKKMKDMDWQEYHRLAVIHNWMDELERTYPSICTVGVIGKSLEERDIKMLKISNSNAKNAAVWIDAGIHAREWIGPAVNTYIANYLVTNFNTLPVSITSKDWYFVPVVNPDGYEYSHTHDRMWRKNRAMQHGKYVGVDLNRNFSYGWGGQGSSDSPNHCFYRGPEPFSEPESSAMRDMILNSGIQFKVYLTLHSYGEVIIFPFASREDLCPDYIRLLAGATCMSKAIYETHGTTYKVGISKDIMYRASGTSNDWSYGIAGIPYCYLIELRSRKHKFKPPQEEIGETGKEILNCVCGLMDFVDSYPLNNGSQGDKVKEVERPRGRQRYRWNN